MFHTLIGSLGGFEALVRKAGCLPYVFPILKLPIYLEWIYVIETLQITASNGNFPYFSVRSQSSITFEQAWRHFFA